MDKIKNFNRLNDSYFKYALATEENKNLTIAFINSALRDIETDEEVPLIEDIIFLDRESSPLWNEAKAPRFDVYARATDGRIFHIEVQVAIDYLFFERSLYYASYDFFMQSKSGEDYDNLSPVIFIGLVDFNLFGEPGQKREWHTLHRILNVKNGEWRLKGMEFHFIEFPVMRKFMKYPQTDFQDILCYFGNVGGKKLMQELAQKNSNVEQLIGIEQKFQTDPILLRRYYFQERAQKDFLKYCDEREVKAHTKGMEKGLKKGLRKGLVEGRIEGVREKAILTAKRMLQIGLPIEQIAEITDLTQNEISAIEL